MSNIEVGNYKDIKLKPCPFCGQEPILEESENKNYRIHHVCKDQFVGKIFINTRWYALAINAVNTWNERK